MAAQDDVDDVEYTPIVAPRGRRVHATSLRNPTETACGRKFKGWRVALRRVNCRGCKLAVALDCRPPGDEP